MSQKILFTDLDGTLLNDEKRISERVKNALFEFHQKGHILVLTSGRPLSSILEVRDALGISFPNSYIISYNGSLTYHCDSQSPVREHTIGISDMQTIMREAHRLDIHCHTYENDCIISEHETPELAYYRQHIHLPFRLVSDIPSALAKAPYKLIAIHLTDHARLERLQAQVLSLTQGRITAVFSNDRYLEFYPADSGKGNAVLDLCQYLHIPVENSAAIGDENNDISMIEAAGLGCAMANAKDCVKAVADFVTKQDNNHDGIEELLLLMTGTKR